MSKKFQYDGKSRPSNKKYEENYNRIFNPTLTKNMKHVKLNEIPPLKGPNSQGLRKVIKKDKKNMESLNGRYR